MSGRPRKKSVYAAATPSEHGPRRVQGDGDQHAQDEDSGAAYQEQPYVQPQALPGPWGTPRARTAVEERLLGARPAGRVTTTRYSTTPVTRVESAAMAVARRARARWWRSRSIRRCDRDDHASGMSPSPESAPALRLFFRLLLRLLLGDVAGAPERRRPRTATASRSRRACRSWRSSSRPSSRTGSGRCPCRGRVRTVRACRRCSRTVPTILVSADRPP